MRGEAERFAIKLVKEHGPVFAAVNPQIIDELRNGMTAEQISQKYHVAVQFGVTEEIAGSIVHEALQRLLTPDEREEIYGPRKKETGRKVGLRSKEEGFGVFGRSSEKRTSDSKKAAAAAKKLGVGIFGMSQKELSDAGKKGGGAVKETGWFGEKIVEEMDEGTFAKELAQKPEFQRPAGDPFAGSPDYTKIMDAVNERYGKNRSRSATKGFFENEKVRAKKKGSST